MQKVRRHAKTSEFIKTYMLTTNEKMLHVLSFVDALLHLSIYSRTASFFLASVLRFKL